LTITTERLFYRDKTMASPGKRLSVSENLENFLERNDKRISELRRRNIHLGALAMPTLAVVYQAIAPLENVYNECPVTYFLLFLAVAFLFICIIIALSMWGNVPNIFEKIAKIIQSLFSSSEESEAMQSEQGIYWFAYYKNQMKYKGNEMKMLKKMNDAAYPTARVVPTEFELGVAKNVTSTATILEASEATNKYLVMPIFYITLCLYALASFSYFIAWKVWLT